MKALSLLFGFRQVERDTRNDVIDVPAFESMILPCHPGLESSLKMSHEMFNGASEQLQSGGRFCDAFDCHPHSATQGFANPILGIVLLSLAFIGALRDLCWLLSSSNPILLQHIFSISLVIVITSVLSGLFLFSIASWQTTLFPSDFPRSVIGADAFTTFSSWSWWDRFVLGMTLAQRELIDRLFALTDATSIEVYHGQESYTESDTDYGKTTTHSLLTCRFNQSTMPK